MKTFVLTTLNVAFLLLCTNGIQAQTTQKQPNKVCLDNTEQFSITSKYVAGENYIIQVGLPVVILALKNLILFYMLRMVMYCLEWQRELH